jgi:hypothetical protein
VVRAGLERPDLLVLRVHRGQDDQWHLTPLAHAAADVGAVAVGQSELDDDGVGHVPRRVVERIGGGARHVHVETSVAQHPPQRQRAERLVIAHEDARPMAHPTCRGPLR